MFLRLTSDSAPEFYHGIGALHPYLAVDPVTTNRLGTAYQMCSSCPYPLHPKKLSALFLSSGLFDFSWQVTVWTNLFIEVLTLIIVQ